MRRRAPRPSVSHARIYTRAHTCIHTAITDADTHEKRDRRRCRSDQRNLCQQVVLSASQRGPLEGSPFSSDPLSPPSSFEKERGGREDQSTRGNKGGGVTLFVNLSLVERSRTPLRLPKLSRSRSDAWPAMFASDRTPIDRPTDRSDGCFLKRKTVPVSRDGPGKGED